MATAANALTKLQPVALSAATVVLPRYWKLKLIFPVHLTRATHHSRDVNLIANRRARRCLKVLRDVTNAHTLHLPWRQLSAVYWKTCSNQQRSSLVIPTFSYIMLKKFLDFWQPPNCNGWVQAFIVTYFVPGMLWLLFFSAIIMIVTLLLHGYCTYVIFQIPLLPIGLAIRGTDPQPALLVVIDK